MALGLNTNISSLTAQRALADANKSLETSMERLSTGLKINSAADDAAGLAVANRMQAQVNGINMAVKNANDATAMTSTIESALSEIGEMLQRARELSVQAASDTNSSTERKYMQDELTALVAEIDRISSATTYNGQNVLDGTFSAKTLQIGASSGETVSLSVASAAASSLGSYSVEGDTIQAQLNDGAGDLDNITDDADDLVIAGSVGSATVNVVGEASAKDVAARINALESSTGVSADAVTHAYLYTNTNAASAVTLEINGVQTESFQLSSVSQSDAIAAINAKSSTSGVTASQATDGRILLLSADGSDIQVENKGARTDLNLKTVSFDGVSEEAKLHVHADKRAGTVNGVTAIIHEIAASAAAATNATLTGSSAAAGNVSLTVASRVSLTSTGNQSGITVTITGTDADGNAQTEVLTGPNNATVTGDKLFKTITQYETAGGAMAAAATQIGVTATLANDATMFIKNNTTGVETSFSSGTTHTAAAYQTAINSALGAVEGTAAVRTTINDRGNNAAGTYYFEHKPTGEVYAVTTTATTSANFNTKLATATHFGGDYHGKSKDLSGLITAADSGQKMSLTGDVIFGDFDVYNTASRDGKVVTLSGNIANLSSGYTVGVENTGIQVSGSAGSFVFEGSRTFGDFNITSTSGGTAIFSSTTTGDLDSRDVTLAASGSSNDAATIQGQIKLSSDEAFTVTQQGTEAAAGSNDNYFTTASATLSTVSGSSVTTQTAAVDAIKTFDAAIEQIASMRSGLGAVQNRLDHTVSNLMAVSENTQAAMGQLIDADFSVESANLAKAQVLLQAGTAMLAQANASPQMVLQLIQ